MFCRFYQQLHCTTLIMKLLCVRSCTHLSCPVLKKFREVLRWSVGSWLEQQCNLIDFSFQLVSRACAGCGRLRMLIFIPSDLLPLWLQRGVSRWGCSETRFLADVLIYSIKRINVGKGAYKGFDIFVCLIQTSSFLRPSHTLVLYFFFLPMILWPVYSDNNFSPKFDSVFWCQLATYTLFLSRRLVLKQENNKTLNICITHLTRFCFS